VARPCLTTTISSSSSITSNHNLHLHKWVHKYKPFFYSDDYFHNCPFCHMWTCLSIYLIAITSLQLLSNVFNIYNFFLKKKIILYLFNLINRDCLLHNSAMKLFFFQSSTTKSFWLKWH
jgi:hypothetical protein